MEAKVFVLGLPGSGKSTAARYIEMLVRDYGWAVTRISDYDILHEMFQAEAETEYKRFRPTQYNGFDVLDLSAFDTALEELEKKVQQRNPLSSEKNELIIIEFARDDYSNALKQFSSDFLQNAYFLFIDSDIPSCVQRIRERVAHPTTDDDHFVSEYIFETYYHRDNRQYMSSNLKTDDGIDDYRVKVVDNTGSQQDFLEAVNQFVVSILSTRTHRTPVLVGR